MTEPLVSICIPTYNGEAYLAQCLGSCMDQTFGDYEIVICDDGSTDSTLQLLENYAAQHPRIRLFKNEKNLGLVANWNRCIAEAKGEWIKFVFQDDYITPDCLQKFAGKIEPAVHLLVCKRNFILPENSSAEIINYYTREVRTLENTSAHTKSFFPPELISKIAVQNICMNFIGEPTLTFFRKAIVKDRGLYNGALKQICDLEFCLRIASKYGLVYLPGKLCAFRIHSSSTTSTNIEKKYFELRYIEPLLFSWCLLFEDAYSDFRKHLGFFQMQKLKLYFGVKCYTAYQADRKEKQEHYLFRDSTHPFFQITAARKGTPLVRLVAWLKR